MAKIVDPSALAQATEVVIDTTGKTIQLLVAGDLVNTPTGAQSGVTLQALYSFLKEQWKDDAALNKFKFPIKMYTKTDGTFINGWTFEDALSRNLVRDAGWTEGSDIYAGIVSLGNFDNDADQAYYSNTIGYSQATIDFDKPGNLDEAIAITGKTGYLKMFLRIRPKLYSEYNLLTEQSIAALEPVLYKLPLANSTDLKTTATDIAVDTTAPFVGTQSAAGTDGVATLGDPTFTSVSAPFVVGDVGKLLTIATGLNAGQYLIASYTSASSVDLDRNLIAEIAITFIVRPKGMKINYLKGHTFNTASAKSYTQYEVGQDTAGRWFLCSVAGTLDASGVADYTNNGGSGTFVAYDGEVQIGALYYAFNRIITGSNGTDRQIYDWAQRQLRCSGIGKNGGVLDINANDSPTAGQRLGTDVNGNIAELLLEYVGDTLKTKPGVLISGFHSDSTNNIKFRAITVNGGGVDPNTFVPIASTEVGYPFVSTGNLVFSQNLLDEANADTIYTMYFANAGGNLFDSANAIKVKNNPYPGGTDIAGQITTSPIGWTFDYDNNEQGGRTKGQDAAVVVVAQGLGGAAWTYTEYTITRTSGQTITITADDERNYANPA